MGEFGEMLVNGTCKNPDGSPLIVEDSDIIGIYEEILKNDRRERNDIIIMWCLTALSKLSIRIGQAQLKLNGNPDYYPIHQFTNTKFTDVVEDALANFP